MMNTMNQTIKEIKWILMYNPKTLFLEVYDYSVRS